MFAVTTNPPVSTGDGIAMALRAGVAVADVEFMQFHPTALHHPSMPRPLLSEALRGEGAVLRDEHGVAFMADEHPLGRPRAARRRGPAISRRLVERDLDHLWLDATGIADFPDRFPTIWRACRSGRARPDPRLAAGRAGRALPLRRHRAPTSTARRRCPGLWSCGEAACSGVHGANRLASNSLLDGLVFAPRAVEAIARAKDAPSATGVLRGRRRVRAGRAPTPRRARVATDGAPIREELQQMMTAAPACCATPRASSRAALGARRR